MKQLDLESLAINPYFKNLSRIRKVLAEDFVDNFGFVYAEQDRILRLKNDDIYQDIIVNLNYAGNLLNNVDNPSVYVELDEGEDNITNVEDNFNRMIALTNVIGQINPQFVDIRTLVESAPIQGSDKMVQYIDQVMQSQSEQGQQENATAQQMQDIEKTKQILDNVKTQRGMMNDEEKLRLESKKIEIGKQKKREGKGAT